MPPPFGSREPPQAAPVDETHARLRDSWRQFLNEATLAHMSLITYQRDRPASSRRRPGSGRSCPTTGLKEAGKRRPVSLAGEHSLATAASAA